MPEQKKYYSAKEACKLLNMPIGYFQQRAQLGIIKAKKVLGRLWVVTPEEIERVRKIYKPRKK